MNKQYQIIVEQGEGGISRLPGGKTFLKILKPFKIEPDTSAFTNFTADTVKSAVGLVKGSANSIADFASKWLNRIETGAYTLTYYQATQRAMREAERKGLTKEGAEKFIHDIKNALDNHIFDIELVFSSLLKTPFIDEINHVHNRLKKTFPEFFKDKSKKKNEDGVSLIKEYIPDTAFNNDWKKITGDRVLNDLIADTINGKTDIFDAFGTFIKYIENNKKSIEPNELYKRISQNFNNNAELVKLNQGIIMSFLKLYFGDEILQKSVINNPQMIISLLKKNKPGLIRNYVGIIKSISRIKDAYESYNRYLIKDKDTKKIILDNAGYNLLSLNTNAKSLIIHELITQKQYHTNNGHPLTWLTMIEALVIPLNVKGKIRWINIDNLKKVGIKQEWLTTGLTYQALKGLQDLLEKNNEFKNKTSKFADELIEDLELTDIQNKKLLQYFITIISALDEFVSAGSIFFGNKNELKEKVFAAIKSRKDYSNKSVKKNINAVLKGTQNFKNIDDEDDEDEKDKEYTKAAIELDGDLINKAIKDLLNRTLGRIDFEKNSKTRISKLGLSKFTSELQNNFRKILLTHAPFKGYQLYKEADKLIDEINEAWENELTINNPSLNKFIKRFSLFIKGYFSSEFRDRKELDVNVIAERSLQQLKAEIEQSANSNEKPKQNGELKVYKTTSEDELTRNLVSDILIYRKKITNNHVLVLFAPAKSNIETIHEVHNTLSVDSYELISTKSLAQVAEEKWFKVSAGQLILKISDWNKLLDEYLGKYAFFQELLGTAIKSTFNKKTKIYVDESDEEKEERAKEEEKKEIERADTIAIEPEDVVKGRKQGKEIKIPKTAKQPKGKTGHEALARTLSPEEAEKLKQALDKAVEKSRKELQQQQATLEQQKAIETAATTVEDEMEQEINQIVAQDEDKEKTRQKLQAYIDAKFNTKEVQQDIADKVNSELKASIAGEADKQLTVEQLMNNIDDGPLYKKIKDMSNGKIPIEEKGNIEAIPDAAQNQFAIIKLQYTIIGTRNLGKVKINNELTENCIEYIIGLDLSKIIKVEILVPLLGGGHVATIGQFEDAIMNLKPAYGIMLKQDFLYKVKNINDYVEWSTVTIPFDGGKAVRKATYDIVSG